MTPAEHRLVEAEGRPLSRRRLICLGGGAAGAAASAFVAPGLRSGAAAAAPVPSPDRSDAHAYRTRPDLRPPRLQETFVAPTPGSGCYLLTPNHGHSHEGTWQNAVMVLGPDGEVAWFRPVAPLVAANLQVQRYRGAPVLTWWQGVVTLTGHGVGQAMIYDDTYHEVAVLDGAQGLQIDLHELTLTDQGTALVTSYGQATADLSPIGGPSQASTLDGVILEIEVATGKVVFEWHSLDQVPISDTYLPPPPDGSTGSFDYFHINSIGVDPTDQNLIVSARNTWALYKVQRGTGTVLWRLGGKSSDFALGPGTDFAWQHHARRMADGSLTVFDDGASPQVEPQSRALHLSLDESGRTVELIRAFEHPAQLLAQNQGSIELTPDGGAVVGWGSEPYFSEFSPTGTLLTDCRYPSNGQSYRAFRSAWSASPTGRPDLVLQADDAGGYTAYASWNGATEVTAWEALSGPSAAVLSPVGRVDRAGFETAMTVHPTGPYLAMAALDRRGRRLGYSAILSLPV